MRGKGSLKKERRKRNGRFEQGFIGRHFVGRLLTASFNQAAMGVKMGGGGQKKRKKR